MSIRKMITEWRKGCRWSGGNPFNCISCTEKLIENIEAECCKPPELDDAFMQSLDRLILACTTPLPEGESDLTAQIKVSKNDLNLLIRAFITTEALLQEEMSYNDRI